MLNVIEWNFAEDCGALIFKRRTRDERGERRAFNTERRQKDFDGAVFPKLHTVIQVAVDCAFVSVYFRERYRVARYC